MSAATSRTQRPAKRSSSRSRQKSAASSSRSRASRSSSSRSTLSSSRKLVLQTVRGMRDILPEQQPYWEQLRRTCRRAAQEYGFSRIQTPLVEFENLFVRSVGEHTEVIEKEMYTFTTRGGDAVALRPELTAGNVRAFIQHGMSVWSKPVKLFSMGPVYRYDRPQEGRYREHYQANYDVFGEEDPIVDAQMVQLAWRILRGVGLRSVVFHINSIGTPKSRAAYKRTLTRYLEKHRRSIPAELRPLIKANPLRILDAKDEACRAIAANAPTPAESLDEESVEHFAAFQSYLEELKIPFVHDQTLVRGLDYYTRTVFEIYVKADEDAGIKRRSLGGGGRYDALLSSLGGPEMPAVGFGLGLDRVVLALQNSGTTEPSLPRPRVFLAQLGALAKRKSLVIFDRLQRSGIMTAESFGRGNLRAQLRKAERSGVDVTIIIGQQEALDETVIIKDMRSGSQETVPQDKMVATVKKLLKK